MGFRIEIDGRSYEATDFTVQEASTPLAAGDSSGQVGTIQITLPKIDGDLNPDHPVAKFGPRILIGKSVRLVDERKGFTLGSVDSVSRSDGGGTFSLNCISRLGELNVYGVQAKPFNGTLAAAFAYYLTLANVTTDYFIDPSIASRPVVFPGWSGELWFMFKQMAAAMDCDISLVSGVIVLRPIRTRIATRGRDLDRSDSSGGGTLAQAVEVYMYNNKVITNKLVYPTGGWTEEVPTINVNSGEYIEEVLELSASVSSINQPLMQTFVGPDYEANSVYTVVGDDGLPIPVAAWNDNGGRLSVVINPDTTSLTVKIQAPTGLPNKDGTEIGVYGISLSSDNNTGRYSTLRIIGSGVAFTKEKMTLPTGVPASKTATEIGVTIDNPFISTISDLYKAGSRAAKGFNGRTQTINGTVTAVNRLGDSGVATYPTYAQVQAMYAGKTYAQVQTINSGKTYAQVRQEFFDLVKNNFENQVFGNVNGARVWDQASRRWYRIRNGSLNSGTIQFQADDDLTYADMQEAFAGMTYAQVKAMYAGATYHEADLMGNYNGSN